MKTLELKGEQERVGYHLDSLSNHFHEMGSSFFLK